MGYKFFFAGIFNTILNPVKAWETINLENRPVKKVRNNLLFPLIMLVSAAAFTGSFLFSPVESQLVSSIFTGIKCFTLMYITIYATSYILGEITYPFDLGRNFSVSFRIIVYSTTPFLMCQILSRIFESLLFVNILGLYGLYIFWTGVEKMLSPPDYKKIPLVIATTITMIGIYVVTDMVLSMVFDRIYFSFFA